MSKAKTGDTVRVHYTGKLDDGSVFDSSAGRDPLEFTLGSQQVIPGFEGAVDGLTIGESVTTRIEPDNAYGHRRDELVLEVARGVPAGCHARDRNAPCHRTARRTTGTGYDHRCRRQHHYIGC